MWWVSLLSFFSINYHLDSNSMFIFKHKVIDYFNSLFEFNTLLDFQLINKASYTFVIRNYNLRRKKNSLNKFGELHVMNMLSYNWYDV